MKVTEEILSAIDYYRRAIRNERNAEIDAVSCGGKGDWKVLFKREEEAFNARTALEEAIESAQGP